MIRLLRAGLLAVSFYAAGAPPAAACDLVVESAWIRDVPGNMSVAAGYARLRNAGKQALRVKSLASKDFGGITTHESRDEQGMAMMRPVEIALAPGASLEFAPGGRHFMLMDARRPLKQGDAVRVSMTDESGCVTQVSFTVRAVP